MKYGWNWAAALLTAGSAAGWVWFGLRWPPDSRESAFQYMYGISLTLLALGVIWTCAELKRRRYVRMLTAWQQAQHDPEHIRLQQRLLRSEGEAALDAEAASLVCSFYEGWAAQWQEGVLPLRAFSGSTAWTMARLYRVLRPYIRQVRNERNPQYALHFERLVRRLRRKYKLRTGSSRKSHKGR
ncbi:hypothetical protein DUZ99_04745 [Xylanibacillus composti]|uniref:DUF4760 domain-containing protein n=1 Tax=Xylanibacillus composti TaxID=1572762 RepID=A0A8J4H5Y0_9BACL|nr:hypothetical protein [Xylanibacillus composti]MDT9724297.1 hypothetical protein [Xylanibacillus composti]GIQ69293.1 hypothetical protein XYCOK13_21170 [Xylanibacillus composti]